MLNEENADDGLLSEEAQATHMRWAGGTFDIRAPFLGEVKTLGFF